MYRKYNIFIKKHSKLLILSQEEKINCTLVTIIFQWQIQRLFKEGRSIQ